MSTESIIKQFAFDCGFDAAGLAPAEMPGTMPHYDNWLNEGLHGELDYLKRHRDMKADPRLLLPRAKPRPKSWSIRSNKCRRKDA